MKKLFKTIQKSLLEEQKILLKKQNASADIDLSGDEVDRIQGKILANINSQLALRDGQRLKSIDSALKRLEEGSYGACEECAEFIAEKRLLFNPCFNLCVSCAEQVERQSKRI